MLTCTRKRMGPLRLLPTLRLTRKKEPRHLGPLGLQEPHILNAAWQAHAECFMESEVFQIYDPPSLDHCLLGHRGGGPPAGPTAGKPDVKVKVRARTQAPAAYSHTPGAGLMECGGAEKRVVKVSRREGSGRRGPCVSVGARCRWPLPRQT